MANISGKYCDRIRRHLLESAEIKQRVAKECKNEILAASQLIIEAFKAGGKVMICGNGGSAADCQHMAGEFICILNKNFDRQGLPAIALTTDASIMTARANDYGFGDIYKRQVDALGKAGDVLIGISTSGNSSNVLAAINSAKLARISTIILTGNNYKIKKMADVVVCVPSDNTQYIQESHLAIEHIICELVEQNLFVSKSKNRYGYK